MCQAEKFFQSFFHIFISQTVDHGVQHGEQHSTKYRNHFVPLKGIAGTWTRVDVENGAIVQGDRDQVGGACEEGFEATLGGADPQDGGDDEEVGGQYEHSGGNDVGGHEEVQHGLVALFHITCQLQQGWDITEKVINDIVATKNQGKSSFGYDGRVNKATKI